MDNFQLIRKYVETDDEKAFEQIVHRHIDLVWATAFRITGNADSARDVTQSVFTDLVRKAERIQNESHLSGWLHRASALSAAKWVRNSVRRRNREKLAMELNTDQEDSFRFDDDRLLAQLDMAVNRLKGKDRQAILLRFFSKKSLAEIGKLQGSSDDAAQKRVSRALEKLRLDFSRQGIAVSSVALTTALKAGAAQSAPAGLAASITGSALTSGGIAASTASTIGVVKNSLVMMKTKLAIGALATVTVVTPLAVQQGKLNALRNSQENLQKQSSSLEELRKENSRLKAREGQLAELERLRQEELELAALRAEFNQSNSDNLATRQELSRKLNDLKSQNRAAEESTDLMEEEQEAEAIAFQRMNDLKHIGLAALVFASNHQDQLPEDLGEIEQQLQQQGMDLELYEMVQQDGESSSFNPHRILFRERNPRQLPDGQWQRAYTLGDGSVQQILSEDGDFSAWEEARTATK